MDGSGTVFHIPEGDESYAERAFRNAANLLDDESTDGDIVIVCNGDGVRHLQKGARHDDRVAALMDAGVSVYACQNSVASLRYETADLIDGVKTAPTAMGELTRRQQSGYAYVRP
jgi:intracellular sulfur oxidation DsrE/DsrF family protein